MHTVDNPLLLANRKAKRVAGRYPDAAPLPDRPELDTLLRDAGSELQWRAAAADGRGAYCSHLRDFVTVGSSTSYTHISGTARVAETPSAAWGDTVAFDERLRRALQNRAFLALTASPRRLADAEHTLASTFDIDTRSADDLLIRHMKAAAREAGADWQVVLRADREPPGSTDWANLMRLVSHRALPRVRAELAEAPRGAADQPRPPRPLRPDGVPRRTARRHDPLGHVYRAEDAPALRAILGRRYHVVVGNPPYITPKDQAINHAYRDRFGSCYRQYSLAVPFTERFFDLASLPRRAPRTPRGSWE